ncbi:MAG: hypothetical protein MK212_21975, partial [Saprospiraceae bacterium]|nr:hypothetical protein [Saprospiraceae bacterium]
GRYYKGEHYRRVEDLLGNDAYLSTANINNPQNYIDQESPAEFFNFYDSSYKDADEPNILHYHNDGLVSWIGLFAQLEYSTERLSTFVSVSGSNQGFKRVDYFNYVPGEQESDWQNFLGGTVKAGLNFNINDAFNIFANAGYFSRQPIFDNVFINLRNDLNEEVENQAIFSGEAGIGYQKNNLKIALNGYYTNWSNRQESFKYRVDETDASTGWEAGDEIQANLSDITQVHAGVELEAIYNPIRSLTLSAMFSYGNWVYVGNITSSNINLDQDLPAVDRILYVDGLSIGDAAQTTVNLRASYEIVKGLRLRANWYMADRIYPGYDITDDEYFEVGAETYAIPTYNLLDLGISYHIRPASNVGITLFANMDNVLDTKYVSETNTNYQDDPATPINEFYNNKGVFGFGRTWNGGLKLEF